MFPWLIVHTVTTAAMAVVVAAACRWSRLGPAAHHLLWLVVLIKLLTPPVVYWPWPLLLFGSAPAVPAPEAPTNGPAPAAVRIIVIDEEPATDPMPAIRARGGRPVAVLPAPPPVANPPAAPAFSWEGIPTAAAWVWLAGAVCVALRNGRCIRSWRRRLARGLPAPDWLVEAVRDLAGSMSLRPPRLVVLPGVASPMVWGFGMPRLIWPLGLEDRLSAEGRRAVLLHELAHLRRRDHWVGWLLLAGGCVWWWHPLFWWVRRRLTQEAELACDAWVVGGRARWAAGLRRGVAGSFAAGGFDGRCPRPRGGGRPSRSRKETGHDYAWTGDAPVVVGRAGGRGRAGTAGAAGVDVGRRSQNAGGAAGATGRDADSGDAGRPIRSAALRRSGGQSRPLGGGAPAAAPPADADRDRKIQELENEVQRLLREIDQLRGQAPRQHPRRPSPILILPIQWRAHWST